MLPMRRTDADGSGREPGIVASPWRVGTETRSVRGPARLLQLYEIAKVLTRIESIETAMPEILALVGSTTPLRKAILLLGDPHGPQRTRAILWHADDVSEDRLRAARDHAYAGFAYLTGSSAPVDEEDAGLLPGAHSAAETTGDGVARGFVLLPLVVGHERVFGVLQVDGAFRLDETDLMFLDAVVGQLAIALDRLAIIRARQADAEARRFAAESTASAALRAEETQRLLAATSEQLANATDERTARAIVGRAAIPHLADVCIFDAITDDGRFEPLEVVAADPVTARLVDHLRALVPAVSTVVSARSRLFAELTDTESMMIVPMTARGRTLGALTLVSVSSHRRYGPDDLALADDIAHRAALAIDNLRNYEQAQHAVRARDDLLSIVSHDLKNPLNNICLTSEAMKHALAPWDAMGSRRVDSIQRAAGRMDRIIMDLLDLASIAAGRMVVDLRPIRVAALVEEVIESHETHAGQQLLRLEHDAVDEALEIDCDRGRVLQVFGNLLGNAIKFTPHGGTVALRAVACGPDVLFSIADTGPGIGPDELPHVFDRYWQARKTAHLGTGLGLSIARAFVEAHGGRIWAESELGAGTTFFFTIPSRVAANAP